ncbi:ribosome hibernation-promoting factor, HPF/YfiA family [Euzebya pacifica]|uniref:ribosome hibernation-promoting factor, HPF/YfiA family n=1 Tax=Euzebya pacifica TaxID=1608957 RepID=UPI0030FC413E
MDITLRARNCEISERVKEEARRKVEHATRFFDRIVDLEVSFAEEHNPRIPNPASVEITARSKKHTVRALGEGQDHHEAIDQAIARFERQLRRYKTRLIDRGRRGRDDARTTGELPKVHRRSSNGQVEQDDPSPNIVKRKEFELTAMFPDDAVLQLELLGHDFYLFTNAGTGAPNVVYRRGDGDIGLIEATSADQSAAMAAAG